MTGSIRLARPAELPVVMTVLHSGALAISAERVRAAIEAEQVLVAAEAGRVLGALVLTAVEGTEAHIEAVAVRPRRRGQGIGTALVRAAIVRYGPLMAEFDEAVRPFWVSLGFDIESADEPGRSVGRFGTDRRE